LIIPACNECAKIPNVINKVKRSCSGFLETILVIDDHSSDNTFQCAKNAGAESIRHEKNMGVGAAIRTGLDWAYNKGYDIAVIISGDDQHNPEEMESVLQPILNKKADFVQGSRFAKGGKTINQTLVRRFLTSLYPFLFFLMTGKRCSDITNGFRAFTIKKIYEDATIDLHQDWLNRYELEVYLLYKVFTSADYKTQEVPISILYHKKRNERTKMRPLIDWWRIFRPLIFLKLKLKK
jgi:dolichol-phosphate mannosyltransferase